MAFRSDTTCATVYELEEEFVVPAIEQDLVETLAARTGRPAPPSSPTTI